MRTMHVRLATLATCGTALAVALALIVTALAAPTARADEPVIVTSSDFDDGTTQGWGPRAGETVAASADAARTGTGGLAVTDRTASWQGPALDLLEIMEPGVRYDFSIWVRMAPGEPSTSLRMSVERRTDGTASYEQVVGNTTVTSGGWVNLEGSYTLGQQVDFLAVYLESAEGTGSFHVDDFALSHVPLPPVQTDLPDLKEVLAPYFAIGASVEPAQALGQHGDLLAKHFNSLTPGNRLKWDATQPVAGEFRFAEADALIDYARAQGMQVRGHTLVWHNQTPAWVFQDEAGDPLTATAEDKALLLQRLEDHIRAVAGRYAGDIAAWDVVNEVIDENQPDGMRRSPWYEITGLDYIRTAFRVAREVAPDATLVINDYNTNVPAKRDALFNLVEQLLAEGVPIDGVGHQMHVNIEWPSVSETEQMLQRFIPLGVDQQITEMDISIYTNSGESFPTPPPERLITQGYRYQAMFDLYRQYAEEISSVTVWGLADDFTWLDSFPVTRKDAPLLFDTRLQAKPAYWGIVDPAYIENPPTSTPSAEPTEEPTAEPTEEPTADPTEEPTAEPTDWPSQDPGGQCQVRYAVPGEWPGGFQGAVTITNSGAAPIQDWQLAWTFPAGQQISQLWNGSYTQSGSAVAVSNASWNGTIASGGVVEFGFLASWTGANPTPTGFTLNGTVCTVT